MRLDQIDGKANPMNKRFCMIIMIVIWFFCAIPIRAAELQANELQDGFLGLKWGVRISGADGYTKLREQGDIAYYRNLNKAYVIDDIRIQHVIYGFYADRFFAVYLHIESPEAFFRIRDYMLSKYGEPKETMAMPNEQTIYRWRHKTVKIKLKRYEQAGNMKLAFYYLPLSSKVNEAEQEKFLEKSYQFFPIEKGKVPEWVPLLRF